MSRPAARAGVIRYPESDGQPMAESDRHRDLMLDLVAAARYHFRGAPDVYVSANLFVYYVEGNPAECVAPDFFVVRGVPKGRRRTYKVWEERKAPEVVIELTSTKTHREDLGRKRDVYEAIGVLEYFLFDPEGVRFQPPLRGFRREGAVLRPVAASPQPNGGLVLASSVLGLDLCGAGDTLRLVDPVSGTAIPNPDDFVREAEEARARAEAERLRAEAATRRVDAERRRADVAEEEARRAAAEVARLRDALSRGRRGPPG